MQSSAQSNPTLDGRIETEVPVQYLRFALGTGSYAVAIDAVREILQVETMTAVPLMPSFMRGVMNLRGSVVPVIDLSARLELPGSSFGRRSCVVIVDIDDPEGEASNTMGMMVDAVYEVFETAMLEPAPAFGTPIAHGFISGMARIDKQVLAVLNLDRVLAQSELSQLVASHVGH
jgi:purine-binding chemotaxis protein CheW